ncbi:MAG: hypothetical protein JWQ84_2441, partial [Mucilaginibacter sp.]|nr:hypothetical protein [Mucilaginibacter sp.]
SNEQINIFKLRQKYVFFLLEQRELF